jgi:quaternary ammonium compound-resistance protein SugE
MHWISLFLAGLFEIGWPLGLKLAQSTGTRVLGIVIACVCIGISGFLLLLAQRQIPIGTAYAIWTGLGAVGTFIVGVVFFKDPSSFLRYFGLSLIVAGGATLKVAS